MGRLRTGKLLSVSVLPRKLCHKCDWGGGVVSYISLDVSVGIVYSEMSSGNSKTLVVACKRRCLWYVLVLALMKVIKL